MKLPLQYYMQEDVIMLAKDLVGKYLFTKFENKLTGGIITETEAYNGIIDRASHAFNGRRTNRNEIMYSKGGTAYVYYCYGIHSLFNVVTNETEIPHAILIRAIYPTHGLPYMRKRKSLLPPEADKIISGPGTVSKVLGIHTSQSGLSLLGNKIWLEDRDIHIPENKIIAGPRIGVESAREAAKLPYRFRVLKWENF